MPHLAHRELLRFSEAVANLSGCPATGPGISNHLLRAVAGLIPVDRVSYNEFDRKSGRLLHAHSLGEAAAPRLVASLNAHLHEHPGFHRRDSASDCPAPTMISDALSQRQFRNLGLYRDHFRLFGIHYQLGIAFAANQRRKICFGLNRARRDFSEEERTLLELLRPHLAHAWRRACVMEELRSALDLRDYALRGATAIVVLDARNEVAFCSAPARELLARYFKGREAGRLPGPLRRWLKERPGSQTNIVFARSDHRLFVRLMKAPAQDNERQLLQLVERPLIPPVEPLLALGLTSREAEVLLWLAQGKRNAEIAVICTMHVTTVNTHLRNIFGKLGVETRTAAAAAAWEAIAERREK